VWSGLAFFDEIIQVVSTVYNNSMHTIETRKSSGSNVKHGIYNILQPQQHPSQLE
jgi:hypothetical protein